MPAHLPEVQRRILQTLCESLHSDDADPPTLETLSRVVGLPSTSVEYHLEALRWKGFVRRDLARRGGLTVDCKSWRDDADVEVEVDRDGEPVEEAEAIGLPLSGTIAAGPPLPTEQSLDERLDVPVEIVPRGADSFVLRVRGDSMVEAGLLDGDLVLIRRQQEADDGDIVAVLLEQDATLKRLSRAGGRVRLLPANPAYEPIDGTNAVIVGKVMRMIRLIPPKDTT